MIIVENITLNGKELTYTYSDANRYIVRDGIEYCEAYDPAELDRTYTEGNYMSAEDTNSTMKEILDILMGGAS